MKIRALIFVSLFLAFVPHVQAFAPRPVCKPATSVCKQIYSPMWEYDDAKNTCFQPYAQCGGAQFSTKDECERVCLVVEVPLVTSPPDQTCEKSNGDANNDGKVTLQDYEIFRQAFTNGAYDKNADFNCDTVVSLLDFERFRVLFTPKLY